MTERDVIRQCVLDECQGNLGMAFEGCLDLLLLERAYSERQAAEVAAWRRGATLGYMRLKAGTVGSIDDVPDASLHDDWLKTATA